MSDLLEGRIGSIVDFVDFDIRTDHRKQRRNRATQSCLHCHTNKRKCDRKRPCQRCTKLGMTGLCIYEVEDPEARRDPNVAETTKLQNRIAELEILVRELRGKPHPRWTNAASERNMSELWHSDMHLQPASSQRTHVFNINSTPLQAPMKNEPNFAVGQLEYHHVLPPSPSSMEGGFKQHSSLARTYANFDLQASASSAPQTFNASRAHFASTKVVPRHIPSCACLADPSTHPALESLTSHIQETIVLLEEAHESSQHSRCPIHQQIIELNGVLCNALQSARLCGVPNVPMSRQGEFSGEATIHAHRLQLWGPTHPESGYNP